MATITKRKKANGKATYTAQVRIKKGGQVVFSKIVNFSTTQAGREVGDTHGAILERRLVFAGV